MPISTVSSPPFPPVPSTKAVTIVFISAIQSLGSLPFSICEPILRSCSAEQLLTVEKNSPHLTAEDQDVWQILCCREFPRYDQSLKAGQVSSPECWREQYYICRREEEKRFEEIGSRIRNRREEADQEKKERQVILTDKLPPAKRSRFNSGGSRSKSLFEKARADSLKVQRLLYGPSVLPPPMHSKAIKPRPSPVNPFSPSKSTISLPRKSSTLSKDKDTESQDSILSPSSKSIPQSVGNSSGSAKRDPMAALFMPKHKAYSQRPSDPPISVQRK